MRLVLSDPDARLRARRGQVKVAFVGDCGRYVSTQSLGSLAQVVLQLAGAQWLHQDLRESDRDHEWSLSYSTYLNLQVSPLGAALAMYEPKVRRPVWCPSSDQVRSTTSNSDSTRHSETSMATTRRWRGEMGVAGLFETQGVDRSFGK